MLIVILLVILNVNSTTIALEGYRLHYKDIEIIENVIDYATYTNETGEEIIFTIEATTLQQYFKDIHYGNFIRVYQVEKNQLKLIYENDFTRVKPWEIDVGFIDRDNILDVYVGAITQTDYYPLEKRPFFFHWTNNYLSRKWTGSYIGFNPLVSIALEDYTKDGIDEVVKKGMSDTGELTTEVYRWGNFGFYKID